MAFAFMEAGIIAWSYEEPLSKETIDRLDPVTATFIVRSLTPDQVTEADRKNGSDSSKPRSTEKALTPTSGS